LSDIQLSNCPFCTGEARFGHNELATFVSCNTCAAKGPGVEGVGFEERLRAAEKWNARGGFGNTRVSLVNDKVPTETYKLIERLRETAETIERGQLGEPDKAALLLFNSKRKLLHIRELRLGQLEINGLVAATVQVLQAQAKARDVVT
jgi:hypothetical protein